MTDLTQQKCKYTKANVLTSHHLTLTLNLVNHIDIRIDNSYDCKNQIVVKNLRIVAQWWTSSEGHLMRLYFSVLQPSVQCTFVNNNCCSQLKSTEIAFANWHVKDVLQMFVISCQWLLPDFVCVDFTEGVAVFFKNTQFWALHYLLPPKRVAISIINVDSFYCKKQKLELETLLSKNKWKIAFLSSRIGF